MTQTLRCFFVDCSKPAEFRFWRLWNNALPVQHCCKEHIPGSKLGFTDEQIKNLHQPTRFYRVEHIRDTA